MIRFVAQVTTEGGAVRRVEVDMPEGASIADAAARAVRMTPRGRHATARPEDHSSYVCQMAALLATPFPLVGSLA